MFAVTAEPQKKPAAHGFDVTVALPSARQNPAAQGVQDAALVKLVPPADHVPAPHCVEGAAEPVPVGQNAPAGHAVPDDANCAQYVPAVHGLAVAALLPVAVQKPGAHAELAGVAVEEPAGQK